MIRLLRAEVDRLLSRRFTKIAVVVVLLVIASFQVVAYFEMQPPTASELADAQRFYAEQHRDWVPTTSDTSRSASTAAALRRSASIPSRSCRTSVRPVLRGRSARSGADLDLSGRHDRADDRRGSFIGAEFSSGSIANWLSFIPRRGQVYASKLITVAVFSAVLSAVATAV